MDVRDIDWAAVMIRSAKATAPTCKPHLDIVNGVAAALPDVFEHFGITTPRRWCHFISESIVEAWYFQTLTELASGDAYDTRTDLGFTAARDGDGRTNKGFGIFQNTGPTNQRRVLQRLLALGFPVTQDVKQARSVLTVPKYAAWAAGIFWDDNKLNAVADKDSTGKLVGRAINRGNWKSAKPANGEAERLKAFKATWKELQAPRLVSRASAPVGLTAAADLPAFLVTARPALVGQPIDRTGMTEDQVKLLDEDVARVAASLLADPHGKFQANVTGQGGGAGAAPVADGGSALNQGLAAPGMDPQEHQDQVAAGEAPDAAPASPSTPLPAEPVAPGLPEALIQATQQRLRDLHYFGTGTADGEPGWKTVQGVAGFQAVHGLPVTGQLDQETVSTIWSPEAQQAPQPADRALATTADLKGKSRIVDAASGVKTASVWQMGAGGVLAAGTAVASGFQSAWETTAPLREVFADVPPVAWGILAAAAVAAPAVYAYWKANQVQAARVQDFNVGKTL
jgi:peptidoglycan hydrolase-like protein with peptidoglycan-binding domain/predicted chitinase